MTLSRGTSRNNGKARQIVSAIVVNLATISFGISCGWPSPVISELRSSQPPFGDAPLNEDQISWISSLPALGGLLTIPFCGSLSERIGRKNFAVAAGLPHIASWLLVSIGQDLISLYVARWISGMAIAMTVFIVPLYTSEIATEDIRGVLGSLLLFSVNLGILFAYVAGTFLAYRSFAGLCLVFPVVFVAAMILFVPETPVYLVRRNRQLQARKSLMFFRGDNGTLVEQELTHLVQSHATTPFATASPFNAASLRDFFNDRATRKGLVVSIGLISAQQLSGIVAMTNYAETIFKLAGSSVSAATASIAIAVVQIVGSQASTMLMERAGRRLLSLISCLGMATSLAVVGLYFHLQRNNYDVGRISCLPLLAVSTYIISYCLGIGPVPFVVVSEVFHLDVGSFATTTCFVFFFVVGFIGIRTFDLVMQFRGPDGCFFMLAIISVTSFLFCYYLLPETKGRTREDILDELGGNVKSRRERKLAGGRGVGAGNLLTRFARLPNPAN